MYKFYQVHTVQSVCIRQLVNPSVMSIEIMILLQSDSRHK